MRKNIVFIVGVIFLFVIPMVSQARDYDYYVNGSVSKSGDGSKEKPFKTIKEAVEKSGDIFIENGKYDGDIELKKSTKIFGESENGVIISGKMILNDDTKIQNMTVRGNRVIITIKKNADADIENCTIKDFGKIGIKAISGSGELEVKNSKIQNGDGKGFYIERGKTIKLLNNEVTDNDEEGVDIRSKVNGTIRGNVITRNGESGIELIVGSSSLQIENNTIKRNGSSGIATQFYPERDSKGQININNNSIGYNNKYGLDCNIPQGGIPGSSYWQDSIELAGNNIFDNQKKFINDYCNLIDATDEDEESDNVISETGSNETDVSKDEIEPELTEEERRQIEIEEEAEKQAKKKRLKEIESLIEKQEAIGLSIEKNVSKLENENKIKVFFLGVSHLKVDNLITALNRRGEYLEKIRLLVEEIDVEAEEEVSFHEVLDNARNEIDEKREVVNNRKKTFSLFGWMINLF